MSGRLPFFQALVPVLQKWAEEIFDDMPSELLAVFFEQALDKGKIKTDLMGKMLGQAK
jgi:hypothetical protein